MKLTHLSRPTQNDFQFVAHVLAGTSVWLVFIPERVTSGRMPQRIHAWFGTLLIIDKSEVPIDTTSSDALELRRESSRPVNKTMYVVAYFKCDPPRRCSLLNQRATLTDYFKNDWVEVKTPFYHTSSILYSSTYLTRVIPDIACIYLSR